MIVRARAPLRLGLGGGGTDVSPYCDMYGGFTLNATIDKYAYTVIEPWPEPDRVRFVASDTQDTWEGDASPQLALDGRLNLHKGVYNRIVRDFNGGRPLTLRNDDPHRRPAGLGARLFVDAGGVHDQGLRRVAEPAAGRVRDRATWPTKSSASTSASSGGRQDQYAATFGGFNFMEFHPGERVVVNPLRIKNWIISELEASLLLYFGGVSRESAEDHRRAVRQRETQRSRRHRRDARAQGRGDRHEGEPAEGRLRPARAIACGPDGRPRRRWRRAYPIRRSTKSTSWRKAAGMRAGKISGAGGGGFMMMLVDPVRRMDVVRVLQQRPGQIFTCHFTKYGTQGWKIY